MSYRARNFKLLLWTGIFALVRDSFYWNLLKMCNPKPKRGIERDTKMLFPGSPSRRGNTFRTPCMLFPPCVTAISKWHSITSKYLTRIYVHIIIGGLFTRALCICLYKYMLRVSQSFSWRQITQMYMKNIANIPR